MSSGKNKSEGSESPGEAGRWSLGPWSDLTRTGVPRVLREGDEGSGSGAGRGPQKAWVESIALWSCLNWGQAGGVRAGERSL